MPVHSDVKEILLTENEIRAIVKRIAEEITKDYTADAKAGKKLLLVGILKGSVVFLADLMREISLPLEIGFIKASSYGAGTTSGGSVRITLDLDNQDFNNCNIIVVEDILDTGNTLAFILNYLKERGAASVKLCALLNKPSRRLRDVTADYEGAAIPNAFVVGYGLDYNEKYRCLPYIGILKPEIYQSRRAF